MTIRDPLAHTWIPTDELPKEINTAANLRGQEFCRKLRSKVQMRFLLVTLANQQRDRPRTSPSDLDVEQTAASAKEMCFSECNGLGSSRLMLLRMLTAAHCPMPGARLEQQLCCTGAQNYCHA